MKNPIPQQKLHGHLHLRASLADQLACQAVGAGIGPVGGKIPRLQIVQNGPWIINVPPFSEGKTVIPLLHFFPPVSHPIFVQCAKYLLLCKTKAVRIHLRSSSYYYQII